MGWGTLVALVVKNLPANAGDIEMWVRSLGRKDPLEDGMTTHSSILAWRIPWTEEPGGSWRVSNNWSDLAHMPVKIQGHLQGDGCRIPLKEDFPIKCEGSQFPISELFSSVERTLVWGADFELEPWSSPHQLCDLGQVTFYCEVSFFPLVKWGSWAS